MESSRNGVQGALKDTDITRGDRDQHFNLKEFKKVKEKKKKPAPKRKKNEKMTERERKDPRKQGKNSWNLGVTSHGFSIVDG